MPALSSPSLSFFTLPTSSFLNQRLFSRFRHFINPRSGSSLRHLPWPSVHSDPWISNQIFLKGTNSCGKPEPTQTAPLIKSKKCLDRLGFIRFLQNSYTISEWSTTPIMPPSSNFRFISKLVKMSKTTFIDDENEQYDYDLFVIGAGSGGVRASRFSANYGAKVAICELPFNLISSQLEGGVGGTCVLRGCVPKKILVYASTFGSDLEDARNFGWQLKEKNNISWKELLKKKTDDLIRLNGVYKRLLSNAGVKLYEGEGRILGPHEVEVMQLDGTKLQFSARNILIATGSRAVRPSIKGQELAITSDEALSLEELPSHAVILGAGYIAVEFASIWRGMGSTVDLCYRKELPLRGFDNEMRDVVARNLQGRGINLHPGTNFSELVKVEHGIKVVTDRGEEFVTDVVLLATGRSPNTSRLNLKAVGVDVDDKSGAVKVDEYSRTSIPSIWAVGDVTNRMNLTPIALMEGSCLAATIFGGKPTKPDYNYVPCAVFCIPPLSVVGQSEEEAVEQSNGEVHVFTSTFNPMKNTISGRQEKTVMKLVVDAQTDRVLGASMCGPDSAEIMQGIAVALKCGATKAQFDSTVGLHPSAAEEFVTMRTVTRKVPGGNKGRL